MRVIFCILLFLGAAAFGEPKIEILDSNPLADLYQLKITGFEEGEKLHIRSQSLHEVIESDAVFPANEFVMFHMVAVVGKARGTANLTITGEKSGAAILEIDWVDPAILEFKALHGSERGR